MKFVVCLGGFLGFTLVMAAGLFAGRRSPSLLLEASLACLLGAILFRWVHRMFLRQVQAALLQQRVEQVGKAPGNPATEKAQPAR